MNITNLRDPTRYNRKSTGSLVFDCRYCGRKPVIGYATVMDCGWNTDSWRYSKPCSKSTLLYLYHEWNAVNLRSAYISSYCHRRKT